MQEFKIILQMFAEGGDGGAAAGEGGETGVEAPVAEESNNIPKPRKRRYNPLENARYGIQDEPQQQAQETAQPVEEDFESLIKGKYKDQFDAHVRTIMDGRFKKANEESARLEKMQRAMELMGRKYNVDTSDTDALITAIEDDDSLYEDEAIERGMSVESLKAIKKLEQDNERMRAQQQRSAQEQMVRDHLNRLGQEASQLKQLYPDFDLQRELQNPMFARLTGPGQNIPLRTAYEVVHRDEMRGAEMQFAAQKSLERAATSIRSNRARPSETAMKGNQGNNTVKTDPRELTKEDRAEIRRRVQRGEKIRF